MKGRGKPIPGAPRPVVPKAAREALVREDVPAVADNDVRGSASEVHQLLTRAFAASPAKAVKKARRAVPKLAARAASRSAPKAGAQATIVPLGSADRAARQRARILDAAERCFIEHGFHAASMADISSTAGMSAGLLYRYFNGKNQIVQAIIQRHLETDGCPAMGRINTRKEFVTGALDMFERWRRRDDPCMNAALMLELSAEAARDPEILRITRAKDSAIVQYLTGAVQRAARVEGAELSALEAQIRAVVLQCVVEGLACRAVRDPDLSTRQLKPIIARVIAALTS